MRTLALLALLVALPVMTLAAEFAVVKGGRLHLREYASSGSRSLGLYDTGTWVELLENAGSWYGVRTPDGKRGYMAQSYLNLGSTGSSATVRYASGNYVNLRSGPSLDYSVLMRVTSGTSITIVDDSYEWNYVAVPASGTTVYGYMHDSLIDRGAVATASVTTKYGGKVNVRSGPGSSYKSLGSLATGTRVTVLLRGNGFSKISGGGLTGYMANNYLTLTGSSSGSSGSTGSVTSTTAYVNNPRSTQVLNLRESPSQTARSIGQYRNGTQVKVVSYGSTWCEVYVGTRHGYMMTQYLSFNGSYLPPTYPTATSIPSHPVTATYPAGQRMTILQYGSSVCMIMVGTEVGYVSTWNVNY